MKPLVSRTAIRGLFSIVAALQLLAAPLANAGTKDGSGGNGLLIDGKPYVLDLVEAGVEKNPFFDSEVPVNPELLATVKKYFPDFPEVADRLAAKLSEVEKVSPIVAWSLLEGFRFYSFRVVEESLVNIHDDDSVVDYPTGTLVQLAIRRGKNVFLNDRLWPALDVDQKVALLLHEIVYVFQVTTRIRKFQGYTQDKQPIIVEANGQSSVGARAITGYLFTRDIQRQGLDGLKRQLFDQSRLHEIVRDIAESGKEVPYAGPLRRKLEPLRTTLFSRVSIPVFSTAVSGDYSYRTNLLIQSSPEGEKRIRQLCQPNQDIFDLFFYHSARIQFSEEGTEFGMQAEMVRGHLPIARMHVPDNGCVKVIKDFLAKIAKL